MTNENCDACPPDCCDMRGMLSFMILWLLSKKPMYGQQLATEIGKRKGANPNPPVKEGQASPLVFTTWRDAVDCARLLLEKGADTEVHAHRGMNPLMNAAGRCSIEMLDLLIEHGAKVNKTGENGETALMLARATTSNGADVASS